MRTNFLFGYSHQPLNILDSENQHTYSIYKSLPTSEWATVSQTNPFTLKYQFTNRNTTVGRLKFDKTTDKSYRSIDLKPEQTLRFHSSENTIK